MRDFKSSCLPLTPRQFCVRKMLCLASLINTSITRVPIVMERPMVGVKQLSDILLHNDLLSVKSLLVGLSNTPREYFNPYSYFSSFCSLGAFPTSHKGTWRPARGSPACCLSHHRRSPALVCSFTIICGLFYLPHISVHELSQKAS